MPTFLFQDTGSGRRRYGVVQATEQEQARRLLKAMRLSTEKVMALPAPIAPLVYLFAPSRSPLKETARFVRQMELLYSSGVGISDLLERLAQERWSAPIAIGLRKTIMALHNGASLSEALGSVPNLLPRSCLTLIRSGERSGRLSDTLRRSAEILESESETLERIKSALVYPCFTLGVFLCAFFLLFVFVLPKFADLLTGLKVQLPLPFQAGLALAGFLAHPLVLLLLAQGLVLGAAAAASWLSTSRGMEEAYRAFSRVPSVRRFLEQSYYATFSFGLSTLISSGLPMTESLSLSAESCPHPDIRACLRQAMERLESGESLAGALQSEGLPSMLCQFVQIGEETGRFDESLGFLRKMYGDETQAVVDRFLSLLEPLLIVVMGGAVGGFLLLALLPLVKLMGSLG